LFARRNIQGKFEPTAPGAVIAAAILALSLVGGQPSSTALAKSSSTQLATVFSDYQCSACSRLLPKINELASKYRSKVRFDFKNFPLRQHKNAKMAAYAAEAAARQGKGAAMHNKLFQGQREWSRAGDPSSVFTKYAKALGLNVPQFTAAMRSSAVKGAVDAEIREGQRLGVNQTPTISFEGKLFTPKNFGALERAIDD